jgi:hypothetical protein
MPAGSFPVVFPLMSIPKSPLCEDVLAVGSLHAAQDREGLIKNKIVSILTVQFKMYLVLMLFSSGGWSNYTR